VTERGWQRARLDEIPPSGLAADRAYWRQWARDPSYPRVWRSIRHYFGLTGFGVNAVEANAGEELVVPHDELDFGGQEELYLVLRPLCLRRRGGRGERGRAPLCASPRQAGSPSAGDSHHPLHGGRRRRRCLPALAGRQLRRQLLTRTRSGSYTGWRTTSPGTSSPSTRASTRVPGTFRSLSILASPRVVPPRWGETMA